MKYSEEQLAELQEVEYSILEEIIRVCDLERIPYFTVGGTTLGAVRHGAMIPWDDDIDIGMLREDYERFLEVAPKRLKEGFTLTWFQTDANAPTYFAKVRKDGTEFVEEYVEDIDMHKGVFVDIMPYDKLPVSERKKKKYYFDVILWNQIYIAKSTGKVSMVENSNNKLYIVIRKVMHALERPVSKAYLYRKLDEKLRKYNATDSQIISSRGIKEFESPISDVFPTVECQFGRLKVMIPRNADKLLRIQYGDYKELPPLDKRYGHAPLKIKLEEKEG